MDKYHFGTTTILNILFGLLTIIDYGYTASIKNKDDTFNINITMPNFNTTQVKYRKLYVLFFYLEYLFSLGRSIHISSI
jgi:hypothetical protein